MSAHAFADHLAHVRHALPFIADPRFAAVAVPAVLLTGLSKSGLAASFGLLAVPLTALRTQRAAGRRGGAPLLAGIGMLLTGVKLLRDGLR